MKALEIAVAGKTFLAGEYLALTGGPALVLATRPCFRLKVRPARMARNPFHAQSPAGLFWQSQAEFFSNYELNFEDPYQVGGFGASSAQFALLHAFWQLKEEAFVESERFFDWHKMLIDYRSLPTQGQVPSGADIVGAVTGGLAWFDRSNGKLQAFSWPFQEIEFFVAHTGKKLATHEHLKELGSFPTEGFAKAMQEIHQGLSQVQFSAFLNGLKAYRAQLEEQGKVATHTLEILRQFDSHPEILFIKGCGAMGSDVVLALCLKQDAFKVRELLDKANLKVMADSSQMASGLAIHHLSTRDEEMSL